MNEIDELIAAAEAMLANYEPRLTPGEPGLISKRLRDAVNAAKARFHPTAVKL